MAKIVHGYFKNLLVIATLMMSYMMHVEKPHAALLPILGVYYGEATCSIVTHIGCLLQILLQLPIVA